jgi:hypothetical protein
MKTNEKTGKKTEKRKDLKPPNASKEMGKERTDLPSVLCSIMKG